MKEVKIISAKEATEFLLPRHYSGRKPQISRAFGLFVDGKLQAVCTFGKPASPSLCVGICGEEYAPSVYELNRLCRLDECTIPMSHFVSVCLKKLKPLNWIIVSYADRGMNHNGYIYQSTNFLYTGFTKERTDKYTEGNKHSRHYSNEKQGEFRKVRTSKHRYVYFATSHKPTKKLWQSALKYPVLKYPKEVNQNYELGIFQETKLVVNEAFYKVNK